MRLSMHLYTQSQGDAPYPRSSVRMSYSRMSVCIRINNEAHPTGARFDATRQQLQKNESTTTAQNNKLFLGKIQKTLPPSKQTSFKQNFKFVPSSRSIQKMLREWVSEWCHDMKKRQGSYDIYLIIQYPIKYQQSFFSLTLSCCWIWMRQRVRFARRTEVRLFIVSLHLMLLRSCTQLPG